MPANQILTILVLVVQMDPRLLLNLIVALLILILLVVGGLTAWSQVRRLTRKGKEMEDQEWEKELMEKIAESSKTSKHFD